MKYASVIPLMIGMLSFANSALAQQMSGTDWDQDYIDDGFEQTLAIKYFPNMNMHCGSYEGTSHGSQGQFYGTNVGYATSGKLPFTAHIYYDPLLQPCNTSGRCIEVRFGMAYNWDLGDDTWGGAHRGDSEIVSILLRTESAWGTAKSNANVWYAWKIYRSAHACGEGDSSSFQTWNSFSVPNVWVSEGKNANYTSQSSCNNGGVASIDDCGDNRCWINRSHATSKLQNVFEFSSSSFIHRAAFTSGYMGPFQADIIPYPGASKTTRPSGQYYVWSNNAFGSAGSYCKHLSRFLDWYYSEQSCSAHPDCP
jgi:hypothetical protein